MGKKVEKKRRQFRKIIAASILLMTCVLLMPSNAEGAGLNKKSVVLLKGKSCSLNLKGTKKKAYWKIKGRSVVRFTDKKNTSVRMKAIRTGTGMITAKIGKKTYQCKIRVVDPKLSSSKLTLKVGETKPLKVQGGIGTVRWKMSNTSVAGLKKGRVTGKRAGTVRITAVCNGKTMTCLVNVKKKAPEKNEEESNAKPELPKKVWVVTKEAWIEFVSIYTNIRSEFECSCGFKTENRDEWLIHEEHHLLNEEPYAYRVNTLKDYVGEERIDHPEEGYWKIIE